jgi:hypothetical protein
MPMSELSQVGQQVNHIPRRLSDRGEAVIDPLVQLEIDNLRAAVSLGLVDGESALMRWQLGAAVGAWLTRTEGQGR